jgi:3-oxosteroid 1-dehydrogenase
MSEQLFTPSRTVDASTDVVVLGSGAAGLVAALAAADAGADVLLIEKADTIGGTTVLSGGVLWLPTNPLARESGIEDDRENALAYLNSLSHDMIRPEMAAAFVDGVAEVLSWLHMRTPLRLRLITGFPDYHPEKPGGLPGGGRSCEPELFSTALLAEWQSVLGGDVRRTLNHESPLGGATGFLPADVEAERSESSTEAAGRALVAALLRACLDRGIRPWTRARATRLIEENGTVVGVEVDSGGRSMMIRAGAVVLATGGFEYDPDLVRDFLRGPMRLPAGAPTNTGDGLLMAMRVGARLSNMREAWWVPVVDGAGLRPDGGNRVFLLLRERTLPRSVMVNKAGRRFVNEAVNYNAMGGALHEFDPVDFSYRNQPCWLVFDQGFVNAYGGFGTQPGGEMPSWVTRAATPAGLAALIGIDAAVLNQTLARWNRQVDAGHDDDFGRGDSAYDWWCGDRTTAPGPGATLGRLDQAPFYAVEVVASSLGTKGGPHTTVDGEVLHVDGNVVRGLYAAGNVMAGPTGMVYGGAGGTLGPAVVFGHRAGRHAAVTSLRGREQQRRDQPFAP